MKTKIFWFALLAILFSVNNSSWAQDYAGSKTVTSAGNVDLSEWIVPTGQLNQRYLLKIVAELVDPQLVKTGVTDWTSVSRSFPNNYPDLLIWVNEQWAPSSLPGPYVIYGDGTVAYDVSYISWPEIWVNGVKVGNIADNGTRWIPTGSTTWGQVGESGGYVEIRPASVTDVVELRLNSFFAGNGGNNLLRLNNVIQTPYNQSVYVLSNGIFQLTTSSGGYGSNNVIDFSVQFSSSPVQYTITTTVDPNSILTPSGEVSVNVGGSQTFIASYSNGYERNQLLVDGSTVVNANTYTFTSVSANHTISLTSKAIVYSITYHANGGSGASNSTYTIESSTITLPTPTKEGNTFKGWYGNVSLTGEVVVSIPSGSTGNKEYWAKWEANAPTQYTITATGDSHGFLSPSGVITVNAGESKTFTTSYDPGYERDKLLVNGVDANANTHTFVNIQESQTITLTSKAIVYNITYYLNGGTGAENVTYTIETGAISLPIPEKVNNHFEGWYDNTGLLGDPIVVLPAGSTGNKEYWAKWSIPDGIEEIENIDFQVYPNPVQSVLFFTSDSPIKRVAIYALSGNKALEKVGDTREVEVSSLHPGVYIVRIVLGNGKTISQKLVKY
ncbi:MAG: InlB B-repeat-containing protein [Candidatus Peribacteria bacterium]|nr:InlB B-repeat-containing protein [Candidatus Peribacteria bacterium]